jgi:parvulin-like peptidyl-prolyl isomerase
MSSFCKSCGTENSGANFCPSCGIAMNSQDSESALSPVEEFESDELDGGGPFDQKRSKRRPTLIVAIALVIVVALVGFFAAFRPSPSAFTINGESYSQDDLNDFVEAFVEAGEITKQNGTIPKEIMNQVIQTLVLQQSLVQFNKKNNLQDSAAHRALVESQIESNPEAAAYPKAVKNFLVDRAVAQNTASKIKKPSSSIIEKMYNKTPSSTGVLCLSHIVVETRAQAEKALKQISDGAKFADVAKKVSIEPAAKTSGGSLGDGDEECRSIMSMVSDQFDTDFMVGAVAAKPGVPTAPVKSQFGWHIILSHPYREVKDSLASVVDKDPVTALYTGFMTTSDIRLNSQYGTWVAAAAKIA